MPSPFPGMDPYLEDPFFWHQVHSQLIVALSHDLGGKLRPKYYAAIEISDVKERYLEIRQVGTHEAIAAIASRCPQSIVDVNCEYSAIAPASPTTIATKPPRPFPDR
jgi:hypothetical protein